jgi:hypothetical protein
MVVVLLEKKYTMRQRMQTFGIGHQQTAMKMNYCILIFI